MRRPRLFVMPRKPRPLVASGILRAPPRQTGGGRERESLVRLAREAMDRGSRSFALASRLFDKGTRERAWLLYAWCRRCDDIADGQDHGGTPKLDESGGRSRIEAIRVLTRRALEGQPTAEVAFDALGQVATEAGLTEDMAGDVIDGFALDAEGWRPRSEGDLMRYCFHVAGAVGVMAARAMGVPAEDHDTLDRATLRRVQTPQGFRSEVLREAYARAAQDPDFTATDDCGVVMRYLPEQPVVVVAGDERNLKVTNPVDLEVVAALLATDGP